ncbi:LEA domain protein [Aspergillus clavatus NRRL 1]|uniref:LEA domain protein n=1 Tax=Aspergillus clavatus (strain ATCC 1007 / CBS 513.65 / DSM 816 / NCTC 3887 / NRRL 1 / QM 1276 / 107) TaxID=344612 RepID=A1C435_ASPCL|nr:LEA domain protein [Aspergillus clavatus NRRL 1]EAW15175.1 LEA domain protein [Aspergillus clavatus NRRL 1]
MASSSLQNPTPAQRTPGKSRKGSGSSAVSKPDLASPKAKKTPRKLHAKEPKSKPIDDPEPDTTEQEQEQEQPSTPSPKPKKKKREPRPEPEQRDAPSPAPTPQDDEGEVDTPAPETPKPKMKKKKKRSEQREAPSPAPAPEPAPQDDDDGDDDGQDQDQEQAEASAPETPKPEEKKNKKQAKSVSEQREASPAPTPAPEDDDDQDDDEDEQFDDAPAPETPDPSRKKAKSVPEQRGIDSPAPDDAQSLASGSASGSAGGSSKASGLTGQAKSLGGKAKDTAEDASEKAKDSVPAALDLSALKGLEVGEGGQVFGQDGNPLGHVVEGDPEDLEGLEIGDDGEILDEDGDLVGRVELLPEAAQNAADDATDAPEQAKDMAGETAEQAKDKAGETADQVKDTAGDTAEQAQHAVTDLADLDGLSVSDGGVIKNKAGQAVAKVSEGDPEDLVGYTVNDEGEIVDEDGDLIGRVELLPQEAQEAAQKAGDVPEEASKAVDQAKDAADDTASHAKDTSEDTADQAKKTVKDLADLEGLPVSEGGVIKDKSGEVVGKIAEGDPEDLVGYTLNDEGEVLDEDGDAIGRAEIVSQKADDVTENASEAADTAKDTAEDAVDQAKKSAKDLADLDGLPVSEGGVIKDKSGEVVGKIAEGDPEDLVGYTLNNEGEVLDEDGDAIGRAEIVSQQADSATDKATDKTDEGEDAKVDEADKLAPEDEQTQKDIAKQAIESVQQQQQPEDIDDKTETAVDDATEKADDDGSDVEDAKDDAVPKPEDAATEAAEKAADDSKADEAEEEEEEAEQLPPLSTLEGLKCTKAGKIISPTSGKPIGELIEGDAKKIAKLGAQLDDKGQFWDNRGKILGKAQTLPVQDYDEEPPFAGLEGLHVVEDGWVEDENGKRVGKIVEGDAKKILGRAVDEDGDVTDKHGNVIARAEYYEAPDEPEAEATDLSQLNGLKPNKLGFVIGSSGVPIARVVEGNVKELAGKEIEDGQIWDGRKAIGRVELIPEEEREKKPEGPFAGLDNLVVNKDGFVEDDDGNVVGQVTEGDAKKLRGRAVDEDGDIIDKFGNVKGHAEPYEQPEEEEAAKPDLSILEGKTVNKAGNVVDAQGNVFGRITSGDKRLAGRKVDGQGQIWGDDGKVIGRAELVPGAEQEKPEGAFFGFDHAEVGKDGVVVDGGRIIGRVVEGDARKLQGRKVDEDGDILDKNGNTIGRAERWEPEEKKRSVNPMSGRKVNRQGEVRDADGNLIGKLTSGNLGTLVGKEIDDNGYVVDNDGNKLGECTLLENLPEEKEEEEPATGPTPEEEEAQKKADQDRELAKKMTSIISQTLDRLHPTCKRIAELIERAERTPKDELDEEKLVKDVKPLIEEGGQVLQECNGAIRALDPDGKIAATAKARAAAHEATPEEYALADKLKELTDLVMNTIENGRKKIADMPHAKKKINPLWALLSEPLFQIIAAVGLLLSGVLGLVGRLLDTLGLGPLVHGLLGGLGLDKILGGLGLNSVTDALGLTGKKN